MNNIFFYDINNYKQEINNIFIHEIPDIYFTHNYGKACEYSDNTEWECCVFKDLIYVYLKKQIVYNNEIYYELITPYGYSGYYFKISDTFVEFIKLFRIMSFKRNYISELIRQNPYINIDISNQYNLIKSKTIYGIKVDNFSFYINNILNCKKRNMYVKSLKQKLTFKLVNLTNSEINNNFYKLYIENMDNVSALKYYYFNKEYFNELCKIDNSYLALVLDVNNIVIGSSIIFVYNNYIHYHLSCNNKSMNCITDFLIINILKEIGINKLFILGGGLIEGDSLEKFKKSLSNKTYTYNIYQNILNKEIYNKVHKI
jgi:hypothetical protein